MPIKWLLAGIFAGISGSAMAEFLQPQPWYAWSNMGMHGSTHNGRGEATFFVPLTQTATSLTFLDARNRLFFDSAIEGNYALGFRSMHENWNTGYWGSVDARRSRSHNLFYQVATGLEAIHPDYDFRLNYYHSLSNPKGDAPNNVDYIISGNQISMVGGREVPLSGYDYEFGIRVPLEKLLSNSSSNDSTLRVFASRFHFDDELAYEKIAGVRGRLEWTYHNVFSDMPGSELVVNYMHSEDDIRGDINEVGVSFKMPFGASKPKKKLNWSKQRQRMNEGLVRDIDIVIGQSKQESVKDTKTGVTIERVEFVDSAADLTTAIAQGAGTLIVVQSNGSDISGNFTLQADQTLLGGAGTLSLTGVSSGTARGYVAPGGKPTLNDASGGAVVTMTDNTHINGVNITGDGGSRLIGQYGVTLGSNTSNAYLTDTSFSNIRDVAVFMDTSNSIDIEGMTITDSIDGIVAVDSNTIVVRNSTISSMSDDAIDVYQNNTIIVSGLSVSNIDDDFLDLDGDNNVFTISSSTISDVDDDIFEIDDQNTLTVTGVTVSNIGDDAFTIDNDNTVTISSSTFTTIGQEFFDANNGNQLTVSDVTLSGSMGAAGFHFYGISNTVSNSNNNVNDLSGSYTLCDASGGGAFSGTISFTDGTTLTDGDTNCN